MNRKRVFKPSYPLLIAIGSIGVLDPAQAATSIFINEIHYDNVSIDSGEAIEIAGPAGTDLSGWSLVLYNGKNSSSYNTKILSGIIPDQNNGFGTVSVGYPTNGIQNGAPDGIALVDDTNNVVQFLSYEGVLTAANGVAAGMLSINIGVAESSSTAIGQSLQLRGSGTQYEDFIWNVASADSFDTVNSNQNFTTDGTQPPIASQCGEAATLISVIQGTDDSSPLAGSSQHIEAVVVADFQGSDKLNGFFVQELDINADNDPHTSEGIFVASNTAVNVGDKVHVVGTVAETYGMTAMDSILSVDVCATDQALPTLTTLTLPFDSVANNPEWFEGMLVNLSQTLTVTENYNLGRFGEILVSSGSRLMIPTQVATPGQNAIDIAEQNRLNSLIIDDASTIQNPDPVIYPGPGGLSAENTLRAGNTITEAMGILSYGFGSFRLQPTAPLTIMAENNRSEPSALPGIGSLKVASFNVLNYFNGDGLGGGFPTARGADTALEFDRQRNKILTAINALDADIIGLMEIENDGYGSQSAIADLVNGLNDLAGDGIYQFIDPSINQIGTDAIAVGMIYKPAKVSILGVAAILDSTVDSRFLDDKNRPALAQTFVDKDSNKQVTIAVNHLKSKGSSCDALGDPDLADGQGNCNVTRTQAAEALADWLASDPTDTDTINTLIIGDLNAYAKEDPITVLRDAGYNNLVDGFIGDNAAYSYVFRGESGYLDHALANASLAEQVKGLTSWHINADEPRALDYNIEYKSASQIADFYQTNAFRSSDHDPLLLELLVPGDLDNDGDVDRNDAGVIRYALGSCSSDSQFNREADYDASGCISYADYRQWYRKYKSFLNNANDK